MGIHDDVESALDNAARHNTPDRGLTTAVVALCYGLTEIIYVLQRISEELRDIRVVLTERD